MEGDGAWRKMREHLIATAEDIEEALGESVLDAAKREKEGV